jgi:hypothetical protein
MMKCPGCQLFRKHCFGRRPYCQCECTAHTFDPADVRFDLIAILGAEANEDKEIVASLIAGFTENQLRVLTLMLTQFVVWIFRQAGQDPVKVIQEAALYWAGGEPEPEDEG